MNVFGPIPRLVAVHRTCSGSLPSPAGFASRPNQAQWLVLYMDYLRIGRLQSTGAGYAARLRPSLRCGDEKGKET